MTFVRTKLLIESMDVGSVAEIRLQGEEPLKNVPRAVRAHGHCVLACQPEDPHHADSAFSGNGPHRLFLKKCPDGQR